MEKEFDQKEIPNIAREIIKKILKVKNNKAKILALSGDLGAGKTTLTQELARQFSVKEKIISPTFVIIKFYNIPKTSIYFSKFKKLIHIDAYRLDEPEELLKIGWNDLNNDVNNFVIVEWPEKIRKYLNKETFWYELEHLDEKNRKIKYLE